VTGHAGLSAARWAAFRPAERILMIGNEANRARRLLEEGEPDGFRRSCERILRLVDLSVEVDPRRSLRRELLRWRDLIAALYVDPSPSRESFASAFRCLLLLHPEAARQIPLLLG
jgi:hypothetical protein